MLTTVVFDLGRVVIRYTPEAAFATVMEPEAALRLLDELDFYAWNDRLDAGLTVAAAQAELELVDPRHATLLGVFRDNFHLATPDEVPGTSDIMRELAAAGLRLLAVTNFPAELFPGAWDRFGIFSIFEGIVVSGVEGVVKPDPAIYQILLDRYGVDPAEAVFIDDKEVNVAAARALGLTGIVFTDAVALRRELAELGLPVSAAGPVAA